MNIAIIGCGYVGTAVARQWHESGHVVTVTTTTEERVADLQQVAQRVVVAKGDDPEALLSVVRNQEVVLLSVGARNPNAYKETYLVTAENLAVALRQAPSVKQLIYTGSYSVYGDKKGKWIDEEAPLAPANENGHILQATEQVLWAASGEDLRVCILRLGGIYGPGREIVKIFRSFAGTTRPGTGEDFSNWIHLDDIVGALDFVRDRRSRGIYHLVNDVPLTMRQLLDELCERHGLDKVSWDPSAHQIRPYNARLSNQKLKAEGFQLIHPETLL